MRRGNSNGLFHRSQRPRCATLLAVPKLEERHSASRALEARVDEVLSGTQELQSDVQRFDSGLVDEDQALPDELNYLTGTLCPARFPAQT